MGRSNRGRQTTLFAGSNRAPKFFVSCCQSLLSVNAARPDQLTGTGMYALTGPSNITAAGIETVNVLPTPGVESTAIFD
jgi:hypothetical protein